MKTLQQYEAEMSPSEKLCPNCGTWLRFPWWRFVLEKSGRCSCCGSYHRDVTVLKSREVES